MIRRFVFAIATAIYLYSLYDFVQYLFSAIQSEPDPLVRMALNGQGQADLAGALLGMGVLTVIYVVVAVKQRKS